MTASKGKKKSNKAAQGPAPTFRFTDLPPELRDLVSEMVFEECSGKKPKLLFAMKGNKKLYAAAKKVWLRTNNFTFTFQESALNRLREGLNGEEIELIRAATIVVS